ncbi:MAG: fibronectin type III domain-containing protein [Lachnospiraceae bacterium]|nr:fibronectin type III domain-containing protein [Lachnospiraceae bacterium]
MGSIPITCLYKTPEDLEQSGFRGFLYRIFAVKEYHNEKRWKKGTGITGYQIQYGRKSSFRGAKNVTIKKVKTVSRVLGGLKKGRKYYVRIRTYKTVGGKKYYSAWSAKKKVKIRK